MAQLRDQQTRFEALNARVVAISFGAAEQARAWLQETGVAAQLLLDPDRVAYQWYGLGYSLRRSWGGRTWARYARLLLSGYRWRGVQGDSGQLGGDVVVDARGFVRFIHRSHDPTDRPSMDRLLHVLEQALSGTPPK